METRTIIIGVGVLAIGGFLAWKFLKKESPIKINEEPTSSNQDEVISDKKALQTLVGGNKPVQGFVANPTASSNKSPFVNASVMKDITIRLANGNIVNLKKGEKLSVANNYGDNVMTYVEGSPSQKLKWDVDVYFPRSSSGIWNTNTYVGSGVEPQFDGGQKKRHNFPYFY